MPRSRGFKFATRGTQGTPMVKLLPADAAQNFTKGEPVTLVGGLLVPAGAGAADIVGVCNEWVTNSTLNQPIEVVLADNETVFKVISDNFVVGVDAYIPANLGSSMDSDAVDGLAVNFAGLGAALPWVLMDYNNTTGHAYVKLAQSFRNPIVD